VDFCGDKIFALYSGAEPFYHDAKGEKKSNAPTKFHVFDLHTGDYIQTLETGYRIRYFCYDKENNRLILSLDDDIQFACLELDGLIK
jgi:hypothetical protein